MQRMLLFVLGILLAIVLLSAKDSPAIDSQKVQAFIGQDLHLSGKKLLSSQLSTGEHTLLFENGFEMSIGAWEFSGDKAVVWLGSKTTEFQGRVRVDYDTIVYMTGKIFVKQLRGGKSTGLSQTMVENGQGQVVRFAVRGEVFVTADEMETGDPSERELYKKAKSQVKPIEQKFFVQKESIVPEFKEEVPAEKAAVKKPAARKSTKKAVGKGGVAAKKEEKPAKGKMVEVKEITAPQAQAVEEANEVEVAAEWEDAAAEAGKAPSVKKEVKFIYPVNFSPVGGAEPKMESTRTEDGRDVATVIGRLYVWQKQDEKGRLLEMQADNAVIFYSSRSMSEKEKGESQGMLGKSPVQAIYLSGDVVMSEGQRTIKTDELYYDFYQKKAIAVNAVMKTFDSTRGIPIYVRAAKMRQVAENKFAADNITITTDEFYQPQVSITASSIMITDTTTVDEGMKKKVSDSSYDAEMRDVRMKMGKQTVFYWPFMRANLWRPDIPIKSLRIGNNRIMGTSVESRWFLTRILGLREPEGTDSTLDVDYYSKRGFGTGVGIDYKQDTYFGNIQSYLISDHGEDRLGRIDSRRDLKPEEELRGRFSWEHRQFMPYNWQLTAGISYLSDEHFLESFYRNEFGTRSQETYVHLKRTQDNWSLSFLGKGRINNFADELEELPSGEYHLTGQSLFDDRATLYSDTQIGRLRQRIGEDHSIPMDENYYTFASHRTELDIPMRIQPFKVVPYAAGTFGYDDRSGFQRSLVDGSLTGEPGEEQVWVGEAGIRVFPQPWWKVYPNVKSRLLDVDQLRHIIKPGFTAAVFNDSTSAFEQRDVFNFSLAQILQTKRGPLAQQRNVDWMRLDLEATFVDHQEEATDAGPGPNRFIWNKPFVPMRVYSAPEIFNGDLSPSLRRVETFGPSRNNFTADYIWRLSDTTAFLSDAYIDMQNGTVDQFNVGFSRLLWPNLSYYIGTRYLRRVEVLDEKGSNAFTFAATYVIDTRYTLVFAQQYDFEYGKNIENEITLIRRYHRMCWGITYRADETLDDKAIIFSIWPQGVPEMGLGSNKRYSGLGGAAGY